MSLNLFYDLLVNNKFMSPLNNRLASLLDTRVLSIMDMCCTQQLFFGTFVCSRVCNLFLVTNCFVLWRLSKAVKENIYTLHVAFLAA